MELTFTVDSALLNELGERLVETVHIALLELVKNSYDADATDVNVAFDGPDSDEFQIVIRDNGCGMTLAEVQRYWMRIATTNKVADSVSALYGRPKSGSKGIGRFSCRRLGNRLKLITTAGATEGESAPHERTEVDFTWTNFRAGTDVTKITCPGRREFLKHADTGTTLIITGGDKWEWGVRSYNYLKRQLAVLVANRGIKRKGFKEDPGFNITLSAPNLLEKPIDLRDGLINAGWGTITAYIQEDGRANCKLVAMDLGERGIVGQRAYEHLSGVSLQVGVLVSDPEQIRNKSLLSKGTMYEILDDWGGIQVRHNGVRIYPYGDDDWLKIDFDRARRLGAPSDELKLFAGRLAGVDPSRALLSLLSHQNYLGTVSINSKNPGFQPKASREGFMETQAFRELRDFARYCIDWAAIYRDFWIRERKKAEAEKARKEFERSTKTETPRSDVIKAAAMHIKTQLGQILTAPTENARQAAANEIAPAINAILANDQANEDELHHLRLIASSSMLLLIFSHEVKSFLSDIDTAEGILGGLLKSSDASRHQYFQKLRRQLSDSKARFEQLLEMTALVGADARKSKAMRLALRDRVERAISCFKLVIDSYNVSVDYSQVAPNSMVGPIMEAELYAILLNTLSNAIKSVIAAGATKKIMISSSRTAGGTRTLISDTGLGLDSSRFQEVFIPFIADPDGKLYSNLDDNLNPADKYIVGTGSGLGLSIVKEIVAIRGGSVRFVRPEKPWKATLEVVLP